jgi:hypothetical protein
MAATRTMREGRQRKQHLKAAALCSAVSLGKSQSGAEIAEFAVVLPVLVLVVFAILWFGLAFNIVSTVQRAAKLGVQTAARPTCALCGNSFSTGSNVVSSITSVLNAGRLNSANLTAYSPPLVCNPTPAPSCSTVNSVEICAGVPLTCGNVSCQQPPVACGVNPALGNRVSFGYRYNSPVPIRSWQAITIPASAQSETEN